MSNTDNLPDDIPARKPIQRIVVWMAWQLVAGIAAMLVSCAIIDSELIARQVENERSAIINMAGGEEGANAKGIRERGRFWGKVTSFFVPSVSEDQIIGVPQVWDEQLKSNSGMDLTTWWNQRMKRNLSGFLPLLFIRLEIVLVTFLVFLATAKSAYFIGERYARLAMRQGRRKGDHRFAWTFGYTKGIIFFIWVLPFIPATWPVVYWLTFAYALTWLGILWVRANTIEV
jgi:hypothetical protein